MGHLQLCDHMVQKPPYWNANCLLGHLKQRKFRLTSFVLDVPVRNLRFSMAVFVPCDHKLQKAYSSMEALSFISHVTTKTTSSEDFQKPQVFIVFMFFKGRHFSLRRLDTLLQRKKINWFLLIKAVIFKVHVQRCVAVEILWI